MFLYFCFIAILASPNFPNFRCLMTHPFSFVCIQPMFGVVFTFCAMLDLVFYFQGSGFYLKISWRHRHKKFPRRCCSDFIFRYSCYEHTSTSDQEFPRVCPLRHPVVNRPRYEYPRTPFYYQQLPIKLLMLPDSFVTDVQGTGPGYPIDIGYP